MDCMRINCAHDNPQAWLGMIRNLQKAREETGRNCRILMDVAGPKLRTGPIEPGPSVIKCRPKRDVYGRVVLPLASGSLQTTIPSQLPVPQPHAFHSPPASSGNSGPATKSAFAMPATRSAPCASLRFWAEVFGPRRGKQSISCPDSRSAPSRAQGPEKPLFGLRRKTRVGKLPSLPQTLLLKAGDTLDPAPGSTLGRPASVSQDGRAHRARADQRFAASNAGSRQARRARLV